MFSQLCMRTIYKLTASILNLVVVAGMLLVPLAPLFPAVEAAAPSYQSVEVCFITFDNDDNILQSLPGNTSISLDLYTDSESLIEGQVNIYGNSFVSVAQAYESVNRDILGADGIDDSYCVTHAFENPDTHEYTYTAASISSDLDWLPIRYNDQNNIDFVDLDIAFPYSGEWFDAIPGNEAERNTNSDGHIIMNAERPDRRLLVVSQLDINLPQYAVVFGDSATSTGEYTLSTSPSALNPGQTINLRFSVQNMGELTWLPGDNPVNVNPVNVSYHWRNTDTGQFVVYDGNRAILNQTVAYTQNDSNIALTVAAPDTAGNYELVIDLVHERVTWFSAAGAATYTIPIQIGIPEPVRDSFIGPEMGMSISLMAASAGGYYTVQPYQGGTWHCGGYDCLSGIAEDYYQCAANGIPNDAAWGDMTTKCWWPIYAANPHLYSWVPAIYASTPWNYLQVGWTLYIPPSSGGGPVVPPPPANSSNFGGIAGASNFDPYAGMNGAWSPWAEVTFDRWVAWDGSWKTDAIKWSETKRPNAPTVTGIQTNAEGTAATIYGVAIPKGHPMHIKVWNEFRHCWACGSGWEYHYQQGTAQHVKIAVFKNNWEFLGYVWNDSPDGRWNITLPLGTALKSGDHVFAEVQIEADYTFGGLKWWSNTFETVNFNLRDPKYTGYPYFSSWGSNAVVVPSVYVDTRSAEEKWIDQMATILGATGGSAMKDVCGYPAKTYSSLVSGAGAVIFVNGRAIYSYGGTWDTFNYYGDRCERFGVPVNNPYVGGNGPFNTAGAYQDFAKGRIYWSWKYVGKFVYGAISSKFEHAGGTNSIYGWPTSETYAVTESGESNVCQNFEGGRICEKDLVDRTSQNFRNKESTFGSFNRLGELHDYCGTSIQDYNQLGSYGRSSLILNPSTGNIHLLTGSLAYTYFNNGACDTFGYPTNDPSTTAGNDGWWQEFSKDTTIYWHKDNIKAQGKWVSGDMRNYHNSLGGTTSYLGFPQNADQSATSQCNVSGEHQEFLGGKIYRSDVATVDMPYNDWIYHYWNRGEVMGDYGWPTSRLASIEGVETITFEAGDMYGKTGALGIGWWIEDRVVGCARKLVERTYNIKLTDGDAAWTDEEIAQVAEAMALLPPFLYQNYLQEIVRNHIYEDDNSIAGWTDSDLSGRKIFIYSSAGSELEETVVHEIMHVYQFKSGGQDPIAYKRADDPDIENYYIAAGFILVDCNLPANYQKCNVRNRKFDRPEGCQNWANFVSRYARVEACRSPDSNYWEEMAESMTYFLIDPNQFTNFKEAVDWPNSTAEGHYEGEPKSSELLMNKYNYIDQNIL